MVCKILNILAPRDNKLIPFEVIKKAAVCKEERKRGSRRNATSTSDSEDEVAGKKGMPHGAYDS
jgi:hypothetical protein